MTVTVTTTAGALRRALTIAAIVAEKRASIPILAHALLSVGATGARIAATDMEIALHLDLPGDAVGSGEVTFPAHRALAALGAAEDGAAVRILAHAGDARVRFSIGPMELALGGSPADDFPAVAALPDDAAPFDLPAPVLSGMIERVFHAISVEETRYYLNGIYLHRVKGTLRAVATDGHRMLWADAPAPDGFPESEGAIIPTRTIKLLRTLLAQGMPGHGADLAVRMGGVKVEISGPGWTVISKTIDGTFPDYMRVAPDPAAEHLTSRVDVRAPAKMGAWLSAILSGAERSTPIALRPHEGGLRVRAEGEAVGSVSLVLPPEVAGYEGKASKAGGAFQARYLRDICEALPEGFALHVDDAHGPTAISAAEGSIRGAIMPMRFDLVGD